MVANSLILSLMFILVKLYITTNANAAADTIKTTTTESILPIVCLKCSLVFVMKLTEPISVFFIRSLDKSSSPSLLLSVVVPTNPLYLTGTLNSSL
ncbi:hypothetical protein D3C73_1383510 [compost metagenome]